MSRRFVIPAVLVLVALAGGVPSQPAPAITAAPKVPQTTTLDDQTELAVTVYNSSIALVRDVRTLTLAQGTSDLHFMDIAATVNPATVHFRSLTEPARVSVLEQNYEYDLLEPEKLLRKYVGRDVTLVRLRQDQNSTREEIVKARLLSFNNGPVWQINGEIVTGMYSDHIRFPELPGNLYSRPTLIWTLENSGAGKHRVEASYLAGQLAWNADYVLTVARDDKTADLDGWVTLKNNSGTGVQKRVAAARRGRSQPRPAGGRSADGRRSQSRASAPHCHRCRRSRSPTTTSTRSPERRRSTTPRPSRSACSARPASRSRSDTSSTAGRSITATPSTPARRSRTSCRFSTSSRTRIRPVSACRCRRASIRVYQSDSRGGVQFVGEDRINHTPKDETLNLKIGNAFDVICERKQTDFEKIATNVYEVEYEVTLRNHKTNAITVQVNEPVGGTWRMLRSSHKWEKSEAWAAQFTVPVAVDGTAVLRYRVRVTY